MDLTTTVVGLSMLGLFIVPIAIMSSKKKKKDQVLLLKLKSLASQNNCEISNYDVESEFAIGIANSKDFVFFVRKIAQSEKLLDACIPLIEIKECLLQSAKRTVKLQKSSVMVTDKLELVFQPEKKDKTAFTCLLYDSEINPQLVNEILIGQKWVSIINEAIKN
ncbi:hypothetical protein [Labilibaculum antarcticum]|uniref:Uncharacterized protein n=1 Tax=Labilibaculum antarcticum TaxID=1717717 RepID=A0A1Y1CPW8_9BACT|nr:hypothetical protein [Labilibaculum antarcticum]BAX82467.1 hypothetical protein ALGA_4176 [Labilibaculum antarcticum]